MPSRALPLVLLAVLTVGCFEDHGRGDSCDCCGTRVTRSSGEDCSSGICDPYCRAELDAGTGDRCFCCGTWVDIGPREDCFSGICDPWCLRRDEDAGPPGACATASARPLDLVCADAIREGEATEVPVAIGGDGECYCGEQVECVARPTGEPFVLEIESVICADGPLCDGCNPWIETRCALPALERGRWTVRNNGEDLFQMNVAPPDLMPEQGATCTHRRAADTFGCGFDWPPRASGAGLGVCHPQGAFTGQRVSLTVTDPCGGCGTSAGPCDAVIFDDVLRLTPTFVDTRCDVDCPDVCVPVEATCVTPPLPEGTWRVFVGSQETGTTVFVPAPGEEPPDPDPVCAGGMP